MMGTNQNETITVVGAIGWYRKLPPGVPFCLLEVADFDAKIAGYDRKIR